MINRNPTKMIATVGPASCDETTLRGMIAAGIDLFRLNFSHGDHETHATSMSRIRRLSSEMGCHIGVIADLQGPKIRTGRLAGSEPVMLETGETVVITTRDEPGTARRICTTYPKLADDVRPDDRILLDDGLMELKVLEVREDEIACEIINGGLLREHKGINLPGVCISEPSLTAKDCDDLQFALKLGVDYIALSFVRHPDDMLQLRERCRELGCPGTGLISKIEKPEALPLLEGIVTASDAVMIARGDLGVELSPEEVPVWQKRIILECVRQNRPVIIATQMLETMTVNPRPTRAEASDVANAVFDGADVLMLSGETAIGKYPVQTVTMMRRIATAAEHEQARKKHGIWLSGLAETELTVADAVSVAAVRAAVDVEAVVIVAFTESGSTAKKVSKRRPGVPILAFTPSEVTARRCNLYWGVIPVLTEKFNDTDEMIIRTTEEAKRQGFVKPGDLMVLTAGLPMGRPGTTNTMRVEKVE